MSPAQPGRIRRSARSQAVVLFLAAVAVVVTPILLGRGRAEPPDAPSVRPVRAVEPGQPAPSSSARPKPPATPAGVPLLLLFDDPLLIGRTAVEPAPIAPLSDPVADPLVGPPPDEGAADGPVGRETVEPGAGRGSASAAATTAAARPPGRPEDRAAATVPAAPGGTLPGGPGARPVPAPAAPPSSGTTAPGVRPAPGAGAGAADGVGGNGTLPSTPPSVPATTPSAIAPPPATEPAAIVPPTTAPAPTGDGAPADGGSGEVPTVPDPNAPAGDTGLGGSAAEPALGEAEHRDPVTTDGGSGEQAPAAGASIAAASFAPSP